MPRRVAAIATSLIVSACTAGELKLDGKSCPCLEAEGWVCDTARNVCVHPSTGSSGSGGGAIGVGTLNVAWATPNGIRWEWEPSGSPDAFQSYEMVVGESEEDVANRTPTARTYDADTNPELGVYLLPRTGQLDEVRATITDGLDFDTPYFGQLIATDTVGGQTRSNIAGARTNVKPGPNSILLFDEMLPAGTTLWPPELTLETDKPYAGTASLRYTQPAPECFDAGCFFYQNLHVDYGTPFDGLQAMISQSAFTTPAFVELAIADDAPTPSFWSNAWISFGACSQCNASIQPLTFRADGQYRIIQIPLRALAFPSGPLVYDDLKNPITEFDLGGDWAAEGTHVWIDAIRVNW